MRTADNRYRAKTLLLFCHLSSEKEWREVWYEFYFSRASATTMLQWWMESREAIGLMFRTGTCDLWCGVFRVINSKSVYMCENSIEIGLFAGFF